MKPESIRSAAPVAPLHQAEAITVGPYVFTSAQMATDWVSAIAPEARINPEFPYFGSAIGRQTDYVLRALSRTLHAAGSGLEHVCKAHVFLRNCADFLGFDQVWNLYFPIPPTRTTVGAAGLLIPEARIEISMIAIIPGCGVEKRGFNSDAPRPMTKKVEAMKAGELVFTSGQLAHDASNGVPREAAGPGGSCDIGLQVDYTLRNLCKSLAAAGAPAERVVKAQALLGDIRDFPGFEPAWARQFAVPPARSTLGVGSLLVGGTLLEIDLTAYVGSSSIRHVRPSQSGIANCAAIRCGDFVFTAGLLPGPENGEVEADLLTKPAYPHYASPIELQTRRVLDDLSAILEEAGSNIEQVAKVQVFLTDLADFARFEGEWKKYFPNAPARSVVQTSGLPVKGARIAIEAIAVAQNP